MKKTVLFILPLSVFLSCTSDSDEVIIPIALKKKKIIEVKQDNQSLYKFTYNTSGYIAEIENFSNGITANITKVEYTNGLETKRNIYNSKGTLFNYQTYTYAGKLISERSSFSINPSTGQEMLTQVTRYTNDTTKSFNNITGVQYYDGSGHLISTSNVIYLDNNGSNTIDIYNASGAKTNITTTMRDNSMSWAKVLDPFIYQREHNIISVSNKDAAGTPVTGYTVDYTYDQDKYPLTAQYSLSNGVKYTYTFTWQ
nr:hypothetical protein [uncultured Chryseobacterium sp.]